MKKILFFATALVAFAACTNESVVDEANEFIVNNEMKAITFGSFKTPVTRGDVTGSDAADSLQNNFVVEGIKWNGTGTQETVFDHYNVNWADNTANTTTSNTSNWEYVAQTKHAHATIAAQSIKYWDYAKSQYDFIAYSAGKATAVFASGDYTEGTNVLFSAIDPSKMNGVDSNSDEKIDQGAYTIKGAAADLAKVYIADLVTVYRDGSATNDAAGKYNQEVDIKFRSLSAKVRIALYETVPGYSVQGASVKFYTDASTKDASGESHLYTTGSDVFNEAGVYTVYFPTTGSANKGATDYNKAHLAFASTTTDTKKAFGKLDATNKYVVREVAETSSTTDKLYIGRESNKATFAGDPNANYYTVVIPNETGAVLNLKVDYTLISTDGSGETINVTGASAQVPAEYATWKSGYAYTYIFKISQNTNNGYTNPSAGPAGLYPITFDAVVMNNEVDGVQETITTVATPSITSYSKGAVVTANDEYKTNANIYVVVEDNGSNVELTASNAKLYTVTLTDGDTSDAITVAAQTINEASVANALAQGGSVTDANKFVLAVAAASGLTPASSIAATDAPDGNAISVKCAYFKPTTAGTYAFEYNDGTKKHYKIIKVVAP